MLDPKTYHNHLLRVVGALGFCQDMVAVMEDPSLVKYTPRTPKSVGRPVT